MAVMQFIGSTWELLQSLWILLGFVWNMFMFSWTVLGLGAATFFLEAMKAIGLNLSALLAVALFCLWSQRTLLKASTIKVLKSLLNSLEPPAKEPVEEKPAAVEIVKGPAMCQERASKCEQIRYLYRSYRSELATTKEVYYGRYFEEYKARKEADRDNSLTQTMFGAKQDRIAHLQGQNEKAGAKIAELEAGKAELKARVAELQGDGKAREAHIAGLDYQVKQLKIQLEEGRQKAEEDRQKAAKQVKRMAAAHKSVLEARDKVASREKARFDRRLKKQQGANGELQEALSAQTKETARLRINFQHRMRRKSRETGTLLECIQLAEEAKQELDEYRRHVGPLTSAQRPSRGRAAGSPKARYQLFRSRLRSGSESSGSGVGVDDPMPDLF
ncbi:hypothetical protein CP532_1869 [Ophiocordyceps camponoti-leonardi (nom. inval.)]|nr:hypothetical protein CP532_1869 [Ophiocordyceps camponoti-leonardi (nom. inval.)]